MKNQSNRRTFLGKLAVLIAAPLVVRNLSWLPTNTAEAADPVMLLETDPMAKNLKYCSNATVAEKAKTTTCPDRKKKEKSDQFCSSCQLYTKGTGAGDKEIGKCMIIPGKTVSAKGWCMSWVKKPK